MQQQQQQQQQLEAIANKKFNNNRKIIDKLAIRNKQMIHIQNVSLSTQLAENCLSHKLAACNREHLFHSNGNNIIFDINSRTW